MTFPPGASIDDVLASISIHLHLSKESEREILDEIRAHLEDAVAEAVRRGEDEQAALRRAAEQFGIVETSVEMQDLHSAREALDAVVFTALPVLFALALRWLAFNPDGTARRWEQVFSHPGFLILAVAALVLPAVALRRWRSALIGWAIFWFLTVIFVFFPNISQW